LNDRLFSKRRRIQFYQELKQNIESGIGLTEALSHLKKQSKSKKISLQIEAILFSLKEGKTFFQAIRCAPSLFSEEHQGLIRIGEQTGKLPEMLQELINDLKKALALKIRLILASIYPTLIISTWVFFFPVVDIVFEKTRCKIDPTYKGGLTLTEIYLNGMVPKLLIVLILIFLIWALPKMLRFFLGKLRYEEFLLKCPVLKSFMKLTIASRTAKLMAIGLEAGVNSEQALNLASSGTNSALSHLRATRTASAIRRGSTLEEAIRETSLFPHESLSAINNGERTGKLPETFRNLSDQWQNQLTTLSSATTKGSFIVMLVALAALVATLVGMQYYKNMNLLFDLLDSIK
jgi:type II secretory pathway component PulF